jgi:hypothetical protein
MKTKTLILAAVLLLLGGAGYYYSNSSVGWGTYTNEEYSFEFRYPADGRVESVSPGYVRIRNFDIASDEGLANNEYDIGVYTQQAVNCQEAVRNGGERSLSGGRVYIGQSYIGGAYVLCAERGSEVTQISFVGNNELADKVFSTFKFTK